LKQMRGKKLARKKAAGLMKASPQLVRKLVKKMNRRAMRCAIRLEEICRDERRICADDRRFAFM